MTKDKKKSVEEKKSIAAAPARPIQKTTRTPAKILSSTSSSEKKAVKELQALTRALMNVSLKLLNSDQAEETVIRSPLSIFKTLLVVHEAAAGETQVELKDFLFDVAVESLKSKFADVLTSLKATGCMELATRIFYDVSAEIRKPFTDTMQQFQVDFAKVDFCNKPAATLKVDFSTISNFIENCHFQQINDFINQGTKGKLESDVTLDALKAGIMAIDTVYFKEQWLEVFDDVTDAEFHETTNRQRTVQMMHLSSTKYFDYAENLQFRVVALPYNWQDADGKRPFQFAIFLPKQLCGLSAIRSTITAAEIERLLTYMRPMMLDLHVPEFEISLMTDLKPTLENAGVKKLFIPGSCDLSNICTKPSFVGEAKHCAMIKVDRHGTEAAAFTRIEMWFVSAMPSKREPFICNHPFLFAILYNKIPLFLGQYV